jgi:hypothetical protein
MRVQFTNPRVAKEFTAAEGFPDRMVNIAKIYMGMLSNISYAGALKMVAGKSNLLFKNEKAVKETPAPQAEEQKPTPETD